MSRLTRDRTAEPVPRDQILRRVRGQGNTYFPCSADHEQDRLPYPVDPYPAIICDDHTYIYPSPVGHRSNLSDIVPRGKKGYVIAVHQIATNQMCIVDSGPIITIN